MGVRADGTLWGWGDNSSHRQLGDDSPGGHLTPTRIGTDDTWVSVSLGEAHSIALRKR
jgi:hypothetical protein